MSAVPLGCGESGPSASPSPARSAASPEAAGFVSKLHPDELRSPVGVFGRPPAPPAAAGCRWLAFAPRTGDRPTRLAGADGRGGSGVLRASLGSSGKSEGGPCPPPCPAGRNSASVYPRTALAFGAVYISESSK